MDHLAPLRRGAVALAPVFLDRIVAAIAAHLFDASGAPIEQRAAQLLYRRQRIAIVEGRVLCADAEHADRASAAAGELVSSS